MEDREASLLVHEVIPSMDQNESFISLECVMSGKDRYGIWNMEEAWLGLDSEGRRVR